MSTKSASLFDDADLVASYSRAQALDDGELVALDPELCRQAGLKLPVAITRAAWAQVIEMTPAAKRAGNDLVGRTWDVLHMARVAASRASGTSSVSFSVYAVVKSTRPTCVQLRMVCGPGDTAAPVLTIMLPEES